MNPRAALRKISRKGAVDTAWALFGFVAPSLLQLAYVVVAARSLHVDEFGQLMLCAAVAAIVMTFSALGSGGVAMKGIAREPGRSPAYFGQTLALTLLSAPLVTPLAVLAMLYVSRVHVPLDLAVCVAVADVICWRVATTCQQVFIGLGQQFRSAMVGMLVPFARLASALFVLVDHPSDRLHAFAIGYAVSGAAAMALAVMHTVQRTGWPRLALRRFQYGEGISFALLWLNGTIQIECDKLILSYFAATADIGIYALASRLMDGAFAPPRAIKISLQARLFREGAAGHNAVYQFSRRIVPIIVAYGLAAWVAIVLLTPLAVRLFGERYAALAGILPLMGALPLLRSIADIGGEVFIASDKVGLSTAIQVLGTAIRIVLGIIFIRAFALQGAAVAAIAATLVAGAVFWVSSWLVTRRPVPAAGT